MVKVMKVSEDIKKINLDEEFRVCPQCSYELGLELLKHFPER